MFWKKGDKTNQKKKKKKEKKEVKKAAVKKTPGSRPEEYIMRKNTVMRVMRIAIWLMLVFIFIRGVAACMQKDSAQQAQTMIRDFREEFGAYKDDNEEIMGFAQNFVREYMTYESRQENDYAQRIRPYVSREIYGRAGDLVDFRGKATAVYAKAYRKESYSEQQYDVYVLADIAYETEDTVEKNGETEKTVTVKKRPVTVKVPVYRQKDGYVVEGIPVIVNDSMGIEGYSTPSYSGTAITDSRTALVQDAVTSFLTAYCEQDQNVIEYYLTKDADREKFRGLSGRYLFDAVESINCYDTGTDILCIVSFTVTDPENGGRMLQSLNISVSADGDRYYIKDMNTKTGHL